MKAYSILFPHYDEVTYKQLSDTTCHDLGMDELLPEMAEKPDEQNLIREVLSHMTPDPRVAAYRVEVFTDIYRSKELRDRIMDVFDRIEHIRDFESVHKSYEGITLWHLFRRLDDLREYILCVEEMRACLSETKVESEGLRGLREYVDELYNEAGFAGMKRDLDGIHVRASEIRSITVGINVNDRLEATGLGLISVNDRPFKKSGMISGFSDAISSGDKLQKGNEWSGDMHFHPSSKSGNDTFFRSLKKGAGVFALQRTPFVDTRTRSSIVTGVMDEKGKDTAYYLEAEMNRMMSKLSRDMRDILSAYADVAIINISGLIPEFVYYIRMAEFIEKYSEKGYSFCLPTESDKTTVKDFYNLRLAINMDEPSEIVKNDINFDDTDRIYILTGANRGGKTTLTQGTGLLFLMAQGGVYTPAGRFEYKPVDAIYTHFPADEDKTTDLGRLGEECKRFKEIYDDSTTDSLILLNETYSTTSFEEGYYIAKDSVKALLRKGVRMIYNTHMHKLGQDIADINSADIQARAVSMIMRTEENRRSFKVELAPPEGISFASDIAKKYGVTYDQLIADQP